MSINKVIYDGNTLIDLTADSVDPSSLIAGYTAHDRSGTQITGAFDPSIYVLKAGDTMTGALHLLGDYSTVFLELSDLTLDYSGKRNITGSYHISLTSYTEGVCDYNAEIQSHAIYVASGNSFPSVENGRSGVSLDHTGELNVIYQENGTYKEISLPNALKTSSGTATRNTTNASAGTCNWSKWGRIVSVVVTGVSLTEDAANNSNIFTGLPNAAEQTNCIAMGNTSGCTRWYVTTGGALRVGAMALRAQTIYLNFTYIAES